jgi:purine-cytosine permease-like protein
MTTTMARHGQARRYVENRHIEYIPPGARHGKPWHQFFFWAGANFNLPGLWICRDCQARTKDMR